MDLLTIIIVLVAVGVILWAINRFIPMEPTMKRVVNIVVIVLVAFWLAKALGLIDALRSVTV